MSRTFLMLGVVIAMSAQGAAGGGERTNTTVVRNGNSVTVITQSGDPQEAEVRIHREPGRTVVERRSGNNTSIVTQSSNPEDFPMDDLPPWMEQFMRDLKPR